LERCHQYIRRSSPGGFTGRRRREGRCLSPGRRATPSYGPLHPQVGTRRGPSRYDLGGRAQVEEEVRLVLCTRLWRGPSLGWPYFLSSEQETRWSTPRGFALRMTWRRGTRSGIPRLSLGRDDLDRGAMRPPPKSQTTRAPSCYREGLRWRKRRCLSLGGRVILKQRGEGEDEHDRWKRCPHQANVDDDTSLRTSRSHKENNESAGLLRAGGSPATCTEGAAAITAPVTLAAPRRYYQWRSLSLIAAPPRAYHSGSGAPLYSPGGPAQGHPALTQAALTRID
jgi:hypothetical protein